MKFLNIFLICFLFALIECRKDDKLIEISDDCTFYDTYLSACFSGSQWESFIKIVIRNNIEFQDFGSAVKVDFDFVNIDCDTVKLPDVDFENFTLLAKTTLGSGCGASYKRRVFKDIENKEIIYEISVTYIGNCDMLQGSRNWALVPRIPDDYTVIIKDKTHYRH